MLTNVLAFDLETIPDVATGRKLYGNPAEMQALSDADVAKVMFHQRKQETQGESEFLRHHLHRIVTIAVAGFNQEKGFFVGSLSEPKLTEKEIIEKFFQYLQEHKEPPVVLVSWNGTGFDLPVLHYRALLHGVNAARYWENNGDFRYNNYTNRYHERHTDVMDVLSAYQARAAVKLDEIAVMLGLPGKMGMSGDKVWDAYLAGQITDIRHYCETDALNTYLIFLRFELMRGHLTEAGYQQACADVQHVLAADVAKPHLQAFLQAWKS